MALPTALSGTESCSQSCRAARGGEVGDPGLWAEFPAGGTVVGYADGYGVSLPAGGWLTIDAGVPFTGEGTSDNAWNQQTVVLVAGVFPLDP